MFQLKTGANIFCKENEGTALDLIRLADALLLGIGGFILALFYECTVVPIALTHLSLIPIVFIVGVLFRMPQTVFVRSSDDQGVNIPLYRIKLSGLLCLLTAPFFVWHRQVMEEAYFTFMGGISLLAGAWLLIELVHIYRMYLRCSDKIKWATYAGWIQLAMWYFVFVPITVVNAFVFFNAIVGGNGLSFVFVIKEFPLIFKLLSAFPLLGTGAVFYISRNVLYRSLTRNNDAQYGER